MGTPEHRSNRPTSYSKEKRTVRGEFVIFTNGIKVSGLTKREKKFVEFLMGRGEPASIVKIREAGIVFGKSPKGFDRGVASVNEKLRDEGANWEITRTTLPGEATPSFLLRELIKKEDK